MTYVNWERDVANGIHISFLWTGTFFPAILSGEVLNFPNDTIRNISVNQNNV